MFNLIFPIIFISLLFIVSIAIFVVGIIQKKKVVWIPAVCIFFVSIFLSGFFIVFVGVKVFVRSMDVGEEIHTKVATNRDRVFDDFLTKWFGITNSPKAANPDTFFEMYLLDEKPSTVTNLTVYVNAIPIHPDHTIYFHFKCKPKDIDRIISKKGLRTVDISSSTYVYIEVFPDEDKDEKCQKYGSFANCVLPEWWNYSDLSGVEEYSYDESGKYRNSLYVNESKTEAYFVNYTY